MSAIISSLLIFFFFFFLCLSTHTCNARHLGALTDDNNASHKKHLFSTIVLESARQLNKDGDPISVHEETSSGDAIIFHESHAVKPKDSDSLLRQMKQKTDISALPVPVKLLVSVSGRVPRKNNLDEGTAIFKPSTDVGTLRETSIEVHISMEIIDGKKKKGSRRRVVEHEHGSQSQVKQDRDPYKAHHYQLEDASVTDYDSPHQKTPVHNR